MDAYMSRKELFKADAKYWNELIGGYVCAFHWKKYRLRNVMDMRAGYGGYFILNPFSLAAVLHCRMILLICD